LSIARSGIDCHYSWQRIRDDVDLIFRWGLGAVGVPINTIPVRWGLTVQTETGDSSRRVMPF
jgi:hypothetical protein